METVDELQPVTVIRTRFKASQNLSRLILQLTNQREASLFFSQSRVVPRPLFYEEYESTVRNIDVALHGAAAKIIYLEKSLRIAHGPRMSRFCLSMCDDSDIDDMTQGLQAIPSLVEHEDESPYVYFEVPSDREADSNALRNFSSQLRHPSARPYMSHPQITTKDVMMKIKHGKKT